MNLSPIELSRKLLSREALNWGAVCAVSAGIVASGNVAHAAESHTSQAQISVEELVESFNSAYFGKRIVAQHASYNLIKDNKSADFKYTINADGNNNNTSKTYEVDITVPLSQSDAPNYADATSFSISQGCSTGKNHKFKLQKELSLKKEDGKWLFESKNNHNNAERFVDAETNPALGQSRTTSLNSGLKPSIKDQFLGAVNEIKGNALDPAVNNSFAQTSLGNVVGCTEYNDGQGCVGTWWYASGGPAVYDASTNRQMPGYVYIDDSTPCNTNEAYPMNQLNAPNGSFDCEQDWVNYYHQQNPNAIIYAAESRRSSVSTTFKNADDTLLEWYPAHGASRDVECGAQGYIVQRFFDGNSAAEPQYTQFNTLWNRAAWCKPIGNMVLAWY